MAERDVNVIGVSQAVGFNIGAARSCVVPNGVDPGIFDGVPEPPSWFTQLGIRIRSTPAPSNVASTLLR